MATEPRSTTAPCVDGELMPQRQVLEDEIAAGADRSEECCDKQTEVEHRRASRGSPILCYLRTELHLSGFAVPRPPRIRPGRLSHPEHHGVRPTERGHRHQRPPACRTDDPVPVSRCRGRDVRDHSALARSEITRRPSAGAPRRDCAAPQPDVPAGCRHGEVLAVARAPHYPCFSLGRACVRQSPLTFCGSLE